jgi:cysteine desulfurase family protein (TIGR01976 family)
LLSPRTRLVACTLASNAIGSIVDIRAAAKLAHAAGAQIFVDAVHYGPHGPIDVQALDCDYLVCSGYKIFAPHMGFVWGRYELLRSLPTFREDFIPDEPPGKLEAGTFIYENVAGMEAAIAYLAEIGRALGRKNGPGGSQSLREDVRQGMEHIRTYEQALSLELLRVIRDCGAQVYGIDDPARVAQRVPTVCFNLPGAMPQVVTETAARAGIGIRDGHLYTPRLMRRFNLPIETGAVRVSLVHYNTFAEIHRLGNVLADLQRGRGR